jgi:hypothetical protein
MSLMINGELSDRWLDAERGRLRPQGLGVPQLDHAGWQSGTYRRWRFQGDVEACVNIEIASSRVTSA